MQVGKQDSNNNLTIVSSNENYNYQYGGIVMQLQVSKLYIQNMVTQQFQVLNTQNIIQAGSIIGNVKSIQSYISFSLINVGCMEYFPVNSSVQSYGIIGCLEGDLYLSQSIIQYHIDGQAILCNTGIIGQISVNSNMTIFTGLSLSFYKSTKVFDQLIDNNIAVLIGYNKCYNVSINDSNFFNITINSGNSAAVLFASMFDSTVKIINLDISMTNIVLVSPQYANASLLISIAKNINMRMQHVKIYDSNISSQSNSSNSAIIIAYSNNNTIITTDINVVECQSISMSAYIAYASAAITVNEYSNLRFYDFKLFGSLIQTNSTFLSGILAGLLCSSQASILQLDSIEIYQSNFSSYSVIPQANAILGQIHNDTVYIQKSSVSEIFINASDLTNVDESFRTEMAISSSFIGMAHNSQIQIAKVQLENSDSYISYKFQLTISGIVSYETLCQINVSEIIIKQCKFIASSQTGNVFAAAVLGTHNIDSSVQTRNTVQIFNVNVQNIYIIGTTQQISQCSGIGSFNYKIIENIQNIKLQNSQIQCNGAQFSRAGAIYSGIAQCTVMIQNFYTYNINVISTTTNNSYIGGLIGNSQDCTITMQSCIIKNSNISGYSISPGNVSITGGIIGRLDVTNLTMIDIYTKNINLITNGVSAYSGSLIGRANTLLDNDIYEYSIVQIYKCQIESTNIKYTSDNPLISLVLYANTVKLAQIKIEIIDTYSTGISYINEQQVSNCQQIQITHDDIMYTIPQYGC
ncbi:Hypothetical_protein [Hexamita inflata]|uniref:Hypothetical_protein n=1 Tax=Hexamita inflata TaxID=28002 RepID=A0AA86QQK5_9EUKA|nr:Hypothetical protein HINF_LOCUS46297 [Hexamita inflata]